MATLPNAPSGDIEIENSLFQISPLFPEFFSQALRKDLDSFLDQLSKDAGQASDLTALALGAKARSILAAPISNENTAALLPYLRETNRALLGLNPAWQDSKRHRRAQDLIAKGDEYAHGGIQIAPQPSIGHSGSSPSIDPKSGATPVSALPVDDVPERVKERYLRNPSNPGLFFFKDRNNDLAFSDTGNKLSTKHNDPIVADSMVAMAISRNWTSLRISGSDEFKKEVWLQAQLAGLLTIGYIPSDADYARLDAAKMLQAEKARKEVDKLAKQHSTGQSQEPSLEQGADTLKQSPLNSAASAQKANTDQTQTIAGEKLIEHGAAPFEFDKRDGAKPNYFIKTQDRSGQERIYWGVGLKDALTQSGAKLNDSITLKRLGKEQVKTDQPIWDESGKLIGHQPIVTERNAWEIKLANIHLATPTSDHPPGPVESLANNTQSVSELPAVSTDSVEPKAPAAPIAPIAPAAQAQTSSDSLWAHKAKAFLNGDPKQVLGAFPELGKTLVAFKAAQSYFEKTVPDELKRQTILSEIKQGLYARILSGNIPQVQIVDERKIGVLVGHGKTEDHSYFVSYKDLFGKIQTVKDPALEGAILKTPLAIGQPIELSKSKTGKSISPESKTTWQIKGGDVAIYSQAISFGAVAKAKGADSKAVDLIVKAALIKGHQLAKKGVAIPMPTVFDPKAPAKPMVQTLNSEKAPGKKPKIDRSQSIGR